MSDDRNTERVANSNELGWPPKWAPPGLVALVEVTVLAQEAVDWRAEAFDDDEPIAGCDAVEFLADWRGRMRQALDAYESARASGTLTKTLAIEDDDRDT